ncbi:hypothetical protein CspeluHIS016_0106660 [Cutaneotrichosporon spelunceum]|uniref:Uncharacterized protein n=1 Tax=Cutaneotrichosporon spelunceum TaxID=1672016 RepID=A0AAD3Y870_9TREE|nr:hypothetical protein CspeluHIS016_0106660 [Cutaneotrichosporon spelunceum]
MPSRLLAPPTSTSLLTAPSLTQPTGLPSPPRPACKGARTSANMGAHCVQRQRIPNGPVECALYARVLYF